MKEVIFELVAGDGYYQLLFNDGVWVRWAMDKIVAEDAIERADAKVGSYIREFAPKKVTYIIRQLDIQT